MRVTAALNRGRRVLDQAVRTFQRDDCLQAASSLAFQTALALVPLLAVGFALLKATGQLDAQSKLLQFLGEQILPSSDEARDEIVQRLAGFTANMAAGALGGFGLAATLVTGFMLYLNVESFWNRIHRVRRRRRFLHQFLLFYAGVTLGPFLAAVSLLRTSALFARVGLLGYGLSTLTTPLVFVLLNRLLPHGRIPWRAALAGGACSALLFEASKAGFGLYLAWIAGSYNRIYGALGLLPLFLLWIYVSWVTILLGAEVAHASYRLEFLEAVRAERDEGALVNGPVAARVLQQIAAHFEAGRRALPLGAITGLSEASARRVLARLEERGLVLPLEGGEAFVLARPAAQIRLSEVLAAFSPQLAGSDGLAEVLRGAQARSMEELARVTLQDLVRGPSAGSCA